jgi:hypothetical protein
MSTVWIVPLLMFSDVKTMVAAVAVVPRSRRKRPPQ